MLPGERITLIKKIASRLTRESPGDVRLTLNQFGCPVNEWEQEHGYGPDVFATVVRAIEAAPDETLVSLDEHLYGASDSPTGGASTASTLWPDGMLRLFISHSSVYKQDVSFLASMLQTSGIHGFVAHVDIEPTREWQGEIETALETCHALCAYLTPDFVSSRWCDQEVGFCVARAIPVVSVRQGADPHGFIGKYQALQGAGKTHLQVADEIADALLVHPQTVNKMATPVVRAFTRASSFDEARKQWERVKKIPSAAWTPEMALEATNAARTNGQLTHCTTSTDGPLPDALDSLLRGIFQKPYST